MLWDADHWQEILSGLRKHKLRTGLTAFGVFWGIFMLVLLVGLGNGVEAGVMKQFQNLAVNTLFVWTDRTSIPSQGLKAGRSMAEARNGGSSSSQKFSTSRLS